MDLNKIPVGANPPWDVNVVIEVPLGGEPVKYELDKHSGAIFVDRFLHTAMRYPCNYGFVPHTLSDDGDPVDVMVVTRTPVVPGAVVRARPIGVLIMEDEAGSKFDRELFAGFRRMMGYYPPGTCLELTDRRIALVQQANAFDPDSPLVLVVRDEQGSFEP